MATAPASFIRLYFSTAMTFIFKGLSLLVCAGLVVFLGIGRGWAQTGGPGQPEFTSFEPAQTNQMVNPLTGDFTYSIPVVHVPGPNGGYDMSLFYHGGIQMDQVASWTGLGWNMNPGAITRTVVGIPDDWNDKEVINASAIDFGLSTSKGWGYSVGVSFAQFGQDFDHTSFNGVATHSTNTSVAVAGLKYTWTGANGGNMNGYDPGGFQKGGSAAINLPFWIPLTPITGSGSFHFSKFRYYHKSINTTHKFGVLYTQNVYSSISGNNKFQIGGPLFYDRPLLQDMNFVGDSRSLDDQGNGASFANKDVFIVNSENIGGQIQVEFNDVFSIPREGGTLEWAREARTNAKLANDKHVFKYRKYNLNFINILKCSLSTKNMYFDYVSNQSNSYFKAVPGTLSAAASLSPGIDFRNSYSENAITYNSGSNVTALMNGNKLHNSNDIEFFTNNELSDNNGIWKNMGFMEYGKIHSDRSNPALADETGIGGFMITAPNGITYHFALPVYQFEHYSSIIKNLTNPNDNHLSQIDTNMVATAWLLTGITGADFVDKGTIGEIDDADEGYWVKFNYGKWTDGYLWRTPMNNTEFIQQGRKQLYYLNSIETKTHAALFIKEVREDGLGINETITISEVNDDEDFEKPVLNNTLKYAITSVCMPCSFAINIIKSQKEEKTYKYEYANQATNMQLLQLSEIAIIEKSVLATQVANLSANPGQPISPKMGYRLTTITNQKIIFQKDPLLLFADASEIYETAPFAEFTGHKHYYTDYYDNIIDNNDIIVNSLNKLQRIHFHYNYNLCSGTPNRTSAGGGKLTLHKLIIHGQGDVAVSPSYVFSYEKESDPSYTYSLLANRDEWGFFSNEPMNSIATPPADALDLLPRYQADTWSLSKIQTPLGGSLAIQYESDTYVREAMFPGKIINGLISVPLGECASINANETITFAPKFIQWLDAVKMIPLDMKISGKIQYECGDEMCDKVVLYDVDYSTGIISLIPSGNACIVQHSNCFVYNTMYETITFKLGIAFGGGIRVKSIKFINSDDLVETETRYGYKNGVTLYGPGADNVPYASELPSPGVMYEFFTTSSIGKDGNPSGSSQFQFEVIDNITTSINDQELKLGRHFEVVDIQGYKNILYQNSKYNEITNIIIDPDGENSAKDILRVDENLYLRNLIIHDKLSRIGRVLNTYAYDKNNALISLTTYTYDDNSSLDFGVRQSTFLDAKKYWKYALPDECEDLRYVLEQDGYSFSLSGFENCFDVDNNGNSGLLDGNIDNDPFFSNTFVTVSSKIKYPAPRLKGVVMEANGITNRVEYVDWDPYTGIPRSQLSTNSYNERITSTTLSAVNLVKLSVASGGIGSPVYPELLNRNILTAPGYTKVTTEKLDANGNPIAGTAGVLSAGFARYATPGSANSTWKYRIKAAGNYQTVPYSASLGVTTMPRVAASYVWKGFLNSDGTLIDPTPSSPPLNAGTQPSDFFPEVDFSITGNPATIAPGWVKTSEITLLDETSHPIEAKDINGHYASSKFGYGIYHRLLFSVSNARYAEATFSGMEDPLSDGTGFGGEVGGCVTCLTSTPAQVHTGKYAVRVGSDQTGRGQWGPGYRATVGTNRDGSFQTGRTYRASIWVKPPQPLPSTINQAELICHANDASGNWIAFVKTISIGQSTFRAGDWYLLSIDISTESLPSGTESLSIYFHSNLAYDVYVDDFRVHPIDAPFTAYVYDHETGQVTATLDGDNMATKVEYDAAGQPVKTWIETKDGFKLVQEQHTHFARPLE